MPSPTHRSIVHVDMDAFFVSVEIRRRPELAGKAVVVGGSAERGVVAAASYEARRYGVHSAMPSVRARRLCPQAVFLPGDHELYGEVSRQVHTILESYTPLVEPIALDEAFCDVTGSVRLFGSPATIGTLIRERVRLELELSCSVGVAPSKLIAKLASEAAKPLALPGGVEPGRGVVEVTSEELVPFLHAHPVQALWGVGPKTLERLQRVGVRTVGDLALLDLPALITALGRSAGRHLHQLALGIDDRPVVANRDPRSIGHEETFANDRHGRAELQTDLVRLADSVASRLRKAQLCARTVNLKIRYGDFTTVTRALTLPQPVDDAPSLFRTAGELLDQLDLTRGVRLLGVSGSNLVDGGRQLTLEYQTETPGWGGASTAIDEIRDRFGSAAIAPASLAEAHGLRVHRRGMQQWGPGSSSSGSDPPMETMTPRVVADGDV